MEPDTQENIHIEVVASETQFSPLKKYRFVIIGVVVSLILIVLGLIFVASLSVTDRDYYGAQTSLRGDQLNLRAAAEVFYTDNNQSYEGFCESEAVQEVITEAERLSQKYKFNHMLIKCADSKESYAIEIPYNEPIQEKYVCVSAGIEPIRSQESILRGELTICRDNLNQEPARTESSPLYSFRENEISVDVINADGEVMQTIQLADIGINNPKVNFVDVYGSKQSMERMGETVPAILENFDLNYDGINDLGILVDTGPIEPGYVFYISNDVEKENSTSAFRPAKLGYNVSTGPFVVYAPSMIQDGKILQGKFTVTNPRRIDYSYYVYDNKTGMFFDTEIDSQESDSVLEQYDFTYKGQNGKLTHKCVIENGDIFFKPERPERYAEMYPEDKGYCAQGGVLELSIADESKIIEEYVIEKETDYKKIEVVSFSSGNFGARDGSYKHSTSSENSNHRLLIGFYHQPCRWDFGGGVCWSGESLSHVVRLPYPQNTGVKLEVTTISPPLFIFRGYKGLNWNMHGTKFVVRDAAHDSVPSFRVYELGKTEPLFEYVVDYPNANQELIKKAWDDEMVEWKGNKIQILDTVFDTETGEESPAWLNIYAIEQYEPITINGVIYLPEDSSGPAHNPNRFSYDKSKFIAQAQNFSLAAGTFEIYPAAGNNFGYHYLRLGNEVFGMQFTGLGAVALVQFDDMDYPAFEDIGNGYSTDGERIYYVSNPEPLIGTNPSGYEFLELEAVREPVLIVGNIMLHRGKILEGLDYSTLHIGNTDMKPEGYYLSDSDNTVFMQRVQCHVGSYYESATLDDVAGWVPGC